MPSTDHRSQHDGKEALRQARIRRVKKILSKKLVDQDIQFSRNGDELIITDETGHVIATLPLSHFDS
ncbi:hypothetical protein IT408_00560 [Candidatus Uhrbacteria bacterium]|nr:hypothetical protein [Candidatus Uhrbacteria bacterium]